jgi:uncharacterized protein YndB with AHSA1/START domain
MEIPFRHAVTIAVAPATVYSFFERLAHTYTTWHPDHLAFRWITDAGLVDGARASAEHRILGAVHTLPITFVTIDPCRRVAFSWGDPDGSFFAPRDTWLFEETPGGCRFVSECTLVLNGVTSLSNDIEHALSVIRNHLAEEGECLKRLLEYQNRRHGI